MSRIRTTTGLKSAETEVNEPSDLHLFSPHDSNDGTCQMQNFSLGSLTPISVDSGKIISGSEHVFQGPRFVASLLDFHSSR